jgi:hypothetical protein
MIRNFSPESTNPRERRAYAHAMIEAHRNRDVPRAIAKRAIDAANQTTKGKKSGFDSALDHASGYDSVKGAGNAYYGPSWPYPPHDSDQVHLVFEGYGNEGIRTPVKYSTDAWPVIRDELVARGYGMHDAGYGGVVAVVLDRELEVTDQVDIFLQYGWLGHDDPIHETSFC